MIIQGVTLKDTGNVYDAQMITGNNQLLYLDAGVTSSYPGTGTTWYDISGRGNNTFSTTNTAYNSADGGYFNFTPNAWFQTASAKYNTTYTGKTVFITAKLASGMTSGQYRCLFGSNGSNRNFNLYLYYTGSAYQLHYSSGGAGNLSSNISYTPGTWATFAVTHTTGGVLTYYFNGQQVSQHTGVTFNQYLSTDSENVGASDNYWNGAIGVVGVWGSALPVEQIVRAHNNLRSRYGLSAASVPTYTTSGLLAYYDPSTSYSGSGTTLTDLTGNGLNGTLYNSPTYTSGSGGYFTLDGTNDYIATANLWSALSANEDHTVEVWIRPTTTNLNIWSDCAAPNLTSYHASGAQIVSSGPFSQVLTNLYNNVTAVQRTVAGISTLNAWQQVVRVYNGTQITGYYNGANANSPTNMTWSTPSEVGNGNNWYLNFGIGETTVYSGSTANYFSGRIGIIRVYSTALSTAEVLQNYNTTKSLYGL